LREIFFATRHAPCAHPPFRMGLKSLVWMSIFFRRSLILEQQSLPGSSWISRTRGKLLEGTQGKRGDRMSYGNFENDGGEKLPNQKELEKELSEYLSKKYGNRIKIISPFLFPRPRKSRPTAARERRRKATARCSTCSRNSSSTTWTASS